MGRPKEYDRQEKLEQARSLFAERGFSATAMGDLVDALGINRKSLYVEFGSKQALFEEALRLHDETSFSRVIGPLEAMDAGVDEIRQAIRWWGNGARGAGNGVGCLLCNTASERSAVDPGARKHVKSYIARMTTAFRNALSNARASGDLLKSVDVDVEARFLTSHAIGQLTLVRSRVGRDVVESAATVALAHITALTATQDS
jgi:TetR/AcrR family transcriptional regulator, transcriptional repressor for nem operon